MFSPFDDCKQQLSQLIQQWTLKAWKTSTPLLLIDCSSLSEVCVALAVNVLFCCHLSTVLIVADLPSREHRQATAE